ncbi:hypothetical protein AW111_07915 [Escherichia coli]|nr:hypothetical protein BFL20_05655 [Escherichia coli]ASE46225.1 hypothetical protein CEP72_03230 [Escherichia coli O157]EIN53833.1 hypothetical protein ECPA3_3178 [Escherichia coli PA3]EKH19170.1 hypothetical protein ECPA34_1253 [Escherichia coli PA34]EKH59171.1 hypothetical protein ECNE037_1325 [Escherichia coli NE037]EKI89167.1 hypothetical protein ECEC1848_1309 [Escherichia coli EC1848]ERD88728.1 hypothetical protein S1W_1194 [Escherichia coli B84]MBZ4066113.1 hypothetical protein [Esche
MDVKNAKEQDNALKYRFFSSYVHALIKIYSHRCRGFKSPGFWWYTCRADWIDIHSRDTVCIIRNRER